MRKHCPENERLKHRYQAYLTHAKRQSEASLDKAMAAIRRFEIYCKCQPFKKFHINQASGFKQHLAEQHSTQSGKPLSAATLHSTMSALKAFFIWIADQPGYRSRIRYADAEYFNVSERDRSVATAKREQPTPTMEQIRCVLDQMPSQTEIEKRDRALIAFTILTGARDGAIASMQLKHVDLRTHSVLQDAREVRTKFAKTFTSVFFPIGDEIVVILEEWVGFLRAEKLFGDTDPLFPATRVALGDQQKFETTGIDRKPWSNANTIRKIFKSAFANAGLPYSNPHSFRRTLAQLGERLCRTPEEFKAWSQNLGHEQVLTTLTSYGNVASTRQAEILRRLGEPQVREESLLESIRELVHNR